MDHEYVRGGNAEELRSLLDGDAALVHEGLGFEKHTGAAFYEKCMEFGLPGRAFTHKFQDLVTDHETYVMPGQPVLDARVSQKDNHLGHTSIIRPKALLRKES